MKTFASRIAILMSFALQVSLVALAQDVPATNHPPEKAWGAVCEGFRLAVTLPKSAFTNGEPILGKVEVQNASDVYLEYVDNVPTYKELVVTNERGERLPVKEALHPKTPFEERLSKVVQNPKLLPVAPGKDNSFPVRLDTLYDLAPGKYTVVFHLQVPKRDDARRQAEASSAPVEVQVLKQ